MSEIGRYRVCGRREFRGHQPGSVFEARLDSAAERRAVMRGSIELVERVRVELTPGSYRLPVGWPTHEAGKEVS